MDETSFRARVDRERGHGLIRSHEGPNLLPCCLLDCSRPARRENMVAMREGVKVLFYFFCSDRDRQLWLHSPQDLGNRPLGARGMIS